MYRAAVERRDTARREADNPRATRKEGEIARQRVREAEREIDLLLNRGSNTEADFYTYRYMANEGFIPGYNFPRLPLRVLIPAGDHVESLYRPRFLGLFEFGPRNVLYHRGRKHRIDSCVLPSGGIEERRTRAKLCRECGYIHPGDNASVDLCVQCGTRLDATNSDFPQALFEQPTVRARRWQQISSEEEERTREGYHITTHFRSAAGFAPRVCRFGTTEDEPVLEIAYLPQAELWRINHGWRRSLERDGFVMDQANGQWVGRDRDVDENSDGRIDAPITGIKPFARDTRNLLFVRPIGEETANEAFLKTLAYALRRAIQLIHQIEEHEIAVELIGRGEHQRIMMWEAAEGGIGIWERLIDDAALVPELARCALEVTHYDPETGEEHAYASERCAAACYNCLLSYANQPDHRFIDRSLIRDYLLRLRRARMTAPRGQRGYDEQYRWLLARIDWASRLERQFLDRLYALKRRLPDHAQYCPTPEVAVHSAFFIAGA